MKKVKKNSLETTKHGQKERNHSALLMAKSRLVCCQKKKAFQGFGQCFEGIPNSEGRNWERRQN